MSYVLSFTPICYLAVGASKIHYNLLWRCWPWIQFYRYQDNCLIKFTFLKMEIWKKCPPKMRPNTSSPRTSAIQPTINKRGCRNKVDVVCDRPQSVWRRKMIQRSIFIKLIYLKYLTAYYSRPPCVHSPISAYCIAYLIDMHTESYYRTRTEKKSVLWCFYDVTHRNSFIFLWQDQADFCMKSIQHNFISYIMCNYLR